MTHSADDPVFVTHRGGKMVVASTVPLATRDDLSLAYTPGVAEVCLAIAAEPALVDTYTWVSHAVAVVTDMSPPARPCGLCRQTLAEFARELTDLPILVVNPQGERAETTLAELLPQPFSLPG